MCSGIITIFIVQDMQFRLNYDDSMSDLIWASNKSPVIGAVICVNKLYIVNDKLQSLKSISL